MKLTQTRAGSMRQTSCQGLLGLIASMGYLSGSLAAVTACLDAVSQVRTMAAAMLGVTSFHTRQGRALRVYLVRRTLPDLISKWAMRWLCRYDRPRATSRAMSLLLQHTPPSYMLFA